MDLPEPAATASDSPAGSPHSVRVSRDGATVTFLRAAAGSGGDQLLAFDVVAATERVVIGSAVTAYGADPSGTVCGAVVAGGLVVAGPDGVRPIDVAGPVSDPRPDPTGRRVAYVVDRALFVYDRTTRQSALLGGEAGNPRVTWGSPDDAAAHGFGRVSGYEWSPDGQSVLATRVDTTRVQTTPYPMPGTPTAAVSLHLLDLDGGWVDVHWDRETYPYLAAATWGESGGPLITVLRRAQQHGLVLAIDARTGETQVHAELADPRWVEPVAGSPAYLADGRVLIGGELAHDGYDARCLFADGSLLTPASLYVRRVCGRLGPDLLVEASEGEPSEQHLYRIGTRSATAATDARRLTADPGWYDGRCGNETVAIGRRGLDHTGTQWTVTVAGVEVGRLRSAVAAQSPANPPQSSPAESSPVESSPPRPMLERVTDRRLPTAVLYPGAHAGGRLPVVLDIDARPGHQEVVADRRRWHGRQRLADAGFAVVVIDNRGTPGVSPAFEKVVHRRLVDVVLADQVDALTALAGKHPDLDLTRVAARGHGFGGWAAALAVLRRPDVFRCGIAVRPIVDWTQGRAVLAERYLGPVADGADVYAHHSLLEAAAEPARRPEDARTLLAVEAPALAATLRAAGRPVEVAQNAAPSIEVGFLRRALT